MSDAQHAPVFIHSMFRTGSTWLFDRFRRSPEGYWCYQEPYHEFLIKLKDQPDAVLDIHEQIANELRHIVLQRPYFYEIHAIREHVADSFSKCISFDSFFDVQGCPALVDYTSRLIAHAPSRPVLQCCRSFGRIGHLQAQFGGTHVHLWRNPRDQWWSYQVNDYFDVTGLAILNADHPPPLILHLREAIGFTPLRRGTFGEEYEQLLQVPLNSEQRYLLFYTLWFYSLLQNREHGCCDLNIDQISCSRAYRRQAEMRLAELGVHGVDLSTCAVPQTAFDASEIKQFESIESKARHLFEEAGYGASVIATALQAQIDCAPRNHDARPEATRAAYAARQAVARYMNHLAVQRKQHRGSADALQHAMRALEANQACEVEARAHLLSERVQRAEEEQRALRLERDNHALRARIDEVEQARSHLLAQFATLQVQHAEEEQRALRLERDNLVLRARIDEVEQARSHLLAQFATLQAQRAEEDQRVLRLERDNLVLRARIDEIEQARSRLQALFAATESRLTELLASRSWRLTAPLRWVRFQIKLLRIYGVTARLRSLTKKAARTLLGRMFRWSESRPRWRRMGATSARLVGIDARLRALHQHWWLPSAAALSAPGPLADGADHTDPAAAPAACVEQVDAVLSPRARQIKFWLDAARRDHLGGT